jgi:lipoprotein-anchoring transpeptidase ErfK/SrfK
MVSTSHNHRLLVNVSLQRCDLLSNDGSVVASYPVSTSRFGVGFKEGSFQTPTGSFKISEKIGTGEPPWMTFKGRVPTGLIARPGGEDDLILSRILWLDGLDPENSNTHERYIYFHGTNQEEKIGTPASHGCIRLRNLDMINLFDSVALGDYVQIHA